MRREITELLLRSGIAQSDFEAMCNIQPSYKGRLNILENDIAMPISMLNSPNMEHLMQTFSNLFGRIGISNIPNDYVQELCRRQPSYRKLSK